jgi:hypothetical protein
LSDDGTGAATRRDGRELGEAIGRLKALRRQAEASRDEAFKAREQATKERDDARAAAAKAEADFNASPLKGEVDKLRGQLREWAHRRVFDRIALERGADKDAVDLVYSQSGYKAEGDEPDAEAIGTLIDSLKGRAGLSRLFGEAPQAAEAGPGPGRGQGGKAGDAGGKFRATRAQLADPAWCRANGGKRDAAIKAGTFEITDPLN